MPQEIERKFLVERNPSFVRCNDFNYIKQGYIEIGKDGSEKRLRQQGKIYSKTDKSGSGMIRNEENKEISKEEFEKDWPLTEGRVEKIRFYLPFEGHMLEWDIYCSPKHLVGLMIIEVEFQSKEEAEKFIPPEWFGKEVTNDKNYKNYDLAQWAFPTDEIKKLRKERDELWAKSKEKKSLLKIVRIACQLEYVQDRLDELEGDKPSERYCVI